AASERIPEDAKKKAEELEEKNVHVLLIPEKDGHIDVDALMDKLGEMEISGIMSEGGGNLSWSLLREGIVNEVVMFIAPKIFGGITAMTPVEGEGVNFVEDALPLHLVESEILPGGDIYARYIVGPEPEEEDEPMDIETAEPRPLAWISSSPAPEAPKDFQSGAVIETPKTEEAAPAADSLEAMEMGSVSRSKKQQEGWVEADAIPSQEPEGADLEDLYDRPPVELENRIVTAVLSADLNPFNIDENKDK
ncbi:MAG: RibD family protein, partial [Eubacterium sp.]|nr:RibD family protein [Eubacterium sp.]